MQSKTKEWFGKVDPEPHIYTIYTDSALSDREFAAFKSDDSDHLELLYAIDMLNGGIHVDDISGGHSLGVWLQTQKQVYAGRANGVLTDEQIRKLEAIGIVWESSRSLSWDKNYQAASAFYHKNVHLRIPSASGTSNTPMPRSII